MKDKVERARARAEMARIVREVREAADNGQPMKQYVFADKLEVSASYISRIEDADAAPGPKFIRELGRKFDAVAAKKLMKLYRQHRGVDDEEGDASVAAETPATYRSPTRREGYLPLVSKAQCGTWMEALSIGEEPHVEKTWLYVGKKLAARKGLYCVEAEGDSMTGATPSGETIEDGDILVVDPNPDLLENGKVALVRLGSKLTVKIYFDAGDHLILTPTNPKHKRLEPPKAEFDELGGIAHRIVKVQKTHDL